MRTLYLCYLSVFAALTRSQVIPYLALLARRGVEAHLLTFEPNVGRNNSMIASEAAQLDAHGIRLHTLAYHKRPSLPATAYDVLRGVLHGSRLVRAHGIQLVHARGHVPAAIALPLKMLTRVRMVFDIRGLWAEEYVDAGTWRPGGVNFHLTKWIERQAVRQADGIVTLTERARDLFVRDGARPGVPFQVIPTCVDLERFRPDPDWREEIRSRLGLGDRPVVAYVGTLRRWYCLDSMLDFWEEARAIIPDLCFLVLTGDDHAEVMGPFADRGVPAAAYRVLRVPRGEVPRYLAAADFSILLASPCVSLLAGSPTKIGEYLASGLPIVLSTGVGDADRLVAEGVAAPVPALAAEQYRMAARWIARTAGRPEVRERCRRVAEQYFDLSTVGGERYWALYRSVAEAAGATTSG
jgi:glycosyltransferase involved in cell wall biosynthesis